MYIILAIHISLRSSHASHDKQSPLCGFPLSREESIVCGPVMWECFKKRLDCLSHLGLSKLLSQVVVNPAMTVKIIQVLSPEKLEIVVYSDRNKKGGWCSRL